MKLGLMDFLANYGVIIFHHKSNKLNAVWPVSTWHKLNTFIIPTTEVDVTRYQTNAWNANEDGSRKCPSGKILTLTSFNGTSDENKQRNFSSNFDCLCYSDLRGSWVCPPLNVFWPFYEKLLFNSKAFRQVCKCF